MTNENRKSKPTTQISNHPIIVYIGFIASIIGIFVFITGWQNISQVIDYLGVLGVINNPLAESNGIEWEATFYNNKNLEGPLIYEGKIRGARNGLRVNWGVLSPNRKVNKDFFSGVFTTNVDFTAGNYCFMIEVDDGARLFIDGQEIRNVWWGYTPGAVYKTPYQLSEGSHVIELYYYEEFENANFHISWYENPGPECVTVGHPGIE